MRADRLGRPVFAATLVGLGVAGLIDRDFALAGLPVPEGAPARALLGWLCAGVALASGIGLLWQRTAPPAARLLLAAVLLWMLVTAVPPILADPLVSVSWEQFGEVAVMVAGAWTIYAGGAPDWDRRRLAFATGERGVRIARLYYGVAMIAFGQAHFGYLDYTASLVPAWLPAHAAWVVLTGAAYIAAGVAVVFGVCARLAAALSAVQMGLFTLLVWVPALASGSADAAQWSEGFVSWSLTAAAWVVADSFRDTPWLPRARR